MISQPGCPSRLTAAVLALLVACTLHAQTADQEATSLLEKTGKAFTAVSRSATPAVVFIRVEKTVQSGMHGGPRYYQFNDPFNFFGDDFMRRFFGGRLPQQSPRQFKQQGQGSGFLISRDGYILTNNHVVGDADKITVKLHDGTEYPAERVGTDPKSEVAVIKIEGDDFPYLELGSSTALDIGEWVIAIGNPFGLAETVTVGVVSAKGRSNIGIADYEDFIQTDAAINPGNSGGPLLNISGKVVGINTAIYSRSGGYMGIGFAIPIDMAKTIKEQLVTTGKVVRGYLGVYISAVNQDIAASFGLDEPKGILIDDVTDGSPADKAGLEPGDIILKLDHAEVESVGAFRNAISSSPPGTSFTVHIFRDGKPMDVKVTTGSMDEAPELVSGTVEDLTGKAGLTVQDLTKPLAERFGYNLDGGVIVTQVLPESPAWQAGIRPGHLIVEVNRERVADREDFARVLAALEDPSTLLLRVKEGERARYVVLQLND